MKIDFKGLGGEKINYADLFIDRNGVVYEMSVEGFLYAKEGIKAEPAKSTMRTADKTVDLTGNTAYRW